MFRESVYSMVAGLALREHFARGGAIIRLKQLILTHRNKQKIFLFVFRKDVLSLGMTKSYRYWFKVLSQIFFSWPDPRHLCLRESICYTWVYPPCFLLIRHYEIHVARSSVLGNLLKAYMAQHSCQSYNTRHCIIRINIFFHPNTLSLYRRVSRHVKSFVHTHETHDNPPGKSLRRDSVRFPPRLNHMTVLGVLETWMSLH